MKRETQRDPILARVYDYILKGWPNEVPEDMKPYQRRKNETSLCQGCIMWGYRVVIPPKLRPQVLEELHSGHLGIVKMKSLARGHVWWPNIDVDIERIAKSCAGCQEHQKAPTQAPLHPWEWPSDKWQRIHVDYAGPFLGHMFLLVVDAYSKWSEVVITILPQAPRRSRFYAQFSVAVVYQNNLFPTTEHVSLLKNSKHS